MKSYKIFSVLLLLIFTLIAGCLGSNDTPDMDIAAVKDTGINTDSSIEGLSTLNDDTYDLSTDNEGLAEIAWRTDTDPSSGCGDRPPRSGKKRLFMNRRVRTYFLEVPSNYDSSRPYPLVFAFHGLGMNGNNFRRYSGLSKAIGDEAIIVYPNATGNDPAWELKGNDDLRFFDSMVDKLSDQLCVDQSRIFATGHSKGASFCNSLGCHRGDVLRAIAPVASRDANFRSGESCTGQVAVWIAHGENDMIIPFSMGKQARNCWINANGCSSSSKPVYPEDACVEYSGCDDEYPVQWCTHNKNHFWPVFASEAIWDFFSSF